MSLRPERFHSGLGEEIDAIDVLASARTKGMADIGGLVAGVEEPLDVGDVVQGRLRCGRSVRSIPRTRSIPGARCRRESFVAPVRWAQCSRSRLRGRRSKRVSSSE